MKSTAKIGGFAIVAAIVCACADTTPVLVIDERNDASTLDAPEASSALTACLQCLTTPDNPGPGCADEIAACEANAKCKITLECAVRKECFLAPSREDLINCGTACTDEAGIKTESDPSVALAASLDGCIEINCASVCPAYAR